MHWPLFLAVPIAITPLAPPGPPGDLVAQAISTVEVRGTVRSVDGTPVDGATVEVENRATGFRMWTVTRSGRFSLEGLDPGGPYRITARRIGYHEQSRGGVRLTLGEPVVLTFVLQPAAIPLEELRVTTSAADAAAGGTGTTLYDSLLHRLPTLNRDLYDFVGLVPQASVGAGLSAGGAGFRFNNFLVHGVPERSLSGNQPPEFSGGRSIPLSAVSEYQVLLSPFDVRYGDFTGAMVNVATRSGGNEWEGSVFGSIRTEGMARDPAARLPYERVQAGLTVGGPIVSDRLHYFVASELQRLTSRAAGPYVGQPEGAGPTVVVADSDLVRLEEVMAGHGLMAGSGGEIENHHHVNGLYARLDLGLPEWNSRGIAWINFGGSRIRSFSRPDGAGSPFPLSSTATSLAFGVRTTAIRLHTALPRRGGGHNDLLLSHRSNRAEWRPTVRQPFILVGVPSTTGETAYVATGTPPLAQTPALRSWDIVLRDNLTLAVGRDHVVTIGIDAQWFGIRGAGSFNRYGTWLFRSAEALAEGEADRYELERDFGGATEPLTGAHYAIHAGDRWQLGDRVTARLGLRAEWLALRGRAPYNPEIDSIFSRRTDARPARPVHWSPRLGIVWDVDGTGRDRIRTGAGIFTGRPPLAWLHSPRVRYGEGLGLLKCGPTSDALGPPPPFDPDHTSPPTSCGDGDAVVAPPPGDVDLLDPDLEMGRSLRATVGYDRRLPWDLDISFDLLLTRHLADFEFHNLNLRGPVGVDRNGRVMYGTHDAAGAARSSLYADSLLSVVELRNTSRNRALQLSARLEKRFAAGLALSAAYAFSRVRDVQAPLRVNFPGFHNWGTGRPLSGTHEEARLGTSVNEIPHRIVLAGTYRTPSRRWPTEISLLYVGETGRPFTYVVGDDPGGPARGDLNADGSAVNDPVYVPQNAYDTTETRFAGDPEVILRQQEAFERFIRGTPCLDRQRGRILERNSCRAPWTHTTIATLRQSIPVAGRRLLAQVDVYNLLNLIDADRGLHRVPAGACRGEASTWTWWSGSPALLTHVGQTSGSDEPEPVFRFDESAGRWCVLEPESSFQVQLGLRYQF